MDLQKPTSRAKQAGVTLFEVLVAVLILAVGMLGAASLQLNAIRYNTSAAHATQASFIAYDVLDRMRANPERLADYSVQVDECPSSSAVPTSIAAQDLADFASAVGCRLPDGAASIEVDGTRATVSIRWSEARVRVDDPDTIFVISALIRNPQ